MNYSSQILNHLSKGEQAGHVLLVAGAPAVEKNGNLVKVLFNSLLTPDDIRDTLLTFLSHVRRSGAAELGATGMFSFGMAKMGRFRVHYLTQRGSIMVSIQRMPFDVPTLEQTLADPAQIAPAYQLVEQEGGGMIVIT
ncbi:MAG: twitching motility protein, partial [bacterium]